jgi:predicted metal-dependent hydrolase
MSAISSTILSTASSDLLFRGGGRVRALTVRRSATARSLRLSVDPRDGAIRLSLPTRAALKPALAWVEKKRGWIEGALSALSPPVSIASGTVIHFRGVPVAVEWRQDGSRTVRLEGDGLVVGGPQESLEPRILRWLRREALTTLADETRRFAALAGVTVGRVGVGDPRSRWGSCSASGDIRYSWRLILAPPEVLEATVAHEVAHRLHMDHSPAFHAAVARLLGREPAAERQWLRTHGPALYHLGGGA